MPVLMTPPYIQFCDDNGDPLENGLVYTYLAGTTTPKATYTDNTGNTQNTNPVQLDAGGMATIWIEGSYKFVIRSADGSFSRTVDNVTSFNAQVTNTQGFFQTFSGDDSNTAFTLSDDLGTDEKALMIFIDAGLQDVVTNGDFTTDTGWTKGSGWTIAGGEAVATGAISTSIEQNASAQISVGGSYNVTIVMTRSAGSLAVSVGGTVGASRSTSGTFTETIIAGSSQVISLAGSGFTGAVQSIVITPVNSAGYNIQSPLAFTLNGTSLTFAVAPPTGSNNIYVFAPYTLIGAAGAAQTAADSAAASALAAANSAADAADDSNNAQAAYTSTLAAISSISDMNRDDFTGDGAETDFTLSGEPGSENNTWVYINGVYIEKSDYSITDDTISFSIAPTLSASIEVIWGYPIGASVADGSITSIKLASDAVETSKIAANQVTNSRLAQVATATFKGRVSASTGDVEDLNATQATSILNAVVGDGGTGGTKGLVPAPAAGDAAANKYLKADGTWSIISGGSGTVTNVSGSGGLTGTVTTSGSISIDTNNVAGVGSYLIAKCTGGGPNAGVSVPGSILTAVAWDVSGAIILGSTLTGTWRNSTTMNLSINQTGLFIRTA